MASIAATAAAAARRVVGRQCGYNALHRSVVSTGCGYGSRGAIHRLQSGSVVRLASTATTPALTTSSSSSAVDRHSTTAGCGFSTAGNNTHNGKSGESLFDFMSSGPAPGEKRDSSGEDNAADSTSGSGSGGSGGGSGGGRTDLPPPDSVTNQVTEYLKPFGWITNPINTARTLTNLCIGFPRIDETFRTAEFLDGVRQAVRVLVPAAYGGDVETLEAICLPDSFFLSAQHKEMWNTHRIEFDRDENGEISESHLAVTDMFIDSAVVFATRGRKVIGDCVAGDALPDEWLEEPQAVIQPAISVRLQYKATYIIHAQGAKAPSVDNTHEIALVFGSANPIPLDAYKEFVQMEDVPFFDIFNGHTIPQPPPGTPHNAVRTGNVVPMEWAIA